MLNSVILEGVMTAGLTIDGRFIIETSRLEGGEKTKVNAICRLSPTLNSNENAREVFRSGTIFQCWGHLDKINGELGVCVEHFEKRGVRIGKYIFTNKD